MRKKRSKILDIARHMPPLRHSVPDQEFDIQNSEVMKWMLQSSFSWNYIWNNIKQSGAIVYDAGTGTWRGVDYNGDD